MYRIKRTGRFSKDFKRIEKRGYDIGLLMTVAKELAAGRPLAARHCDHQLHGQWVGHRECRIVPDWLLVYRFSSDGQTLYLAGTGTHADLFK
jgi:mRNA interferase YafQ